MGKGFIVEHLGEAHYRIGLEIDVTYARRQLEEIQLYLANFKSGYDEATDRKNKAKAAIEPINTRLNEYLKNAQKASQTAYDAMIVAYKAYVHAVESMPDQDAVDFLFDDSKLQSENFVLDPTNQTAIDALDADAMWQGAVGELLDAAAVAMATDAKDAAVADLVWAQEEYDAGRMTLQALKWYEKNYGDLRAAWVASVTSNSGDALVSTREKAWKDATAIFEERQKELSKLLDKGGMPKEMADILSAQEKAYAEYHAALDDWQRLTLIKTEKEKAATELRLRLASFFDLDSNGLVDTSKPKRQIVPAWCVDATEDLKVGTEVGTIEIPGEREVAVKVRPGYEDREKYQGGRDGLLQPSWASSPEATFFNWALHPGNAKWHPNYRVGKILSIDSNLNTCKVELDHQTNHRNSRAPEGHVLDVNNPVKYEFDANGSQQSVLPGDKVTVANGVTTLSDVPIEYMECNAAVFEVGDKVVVELQNRDWKQPKVIGFAENPKSCYKPGIIIEGHIGGGSVQRLLLRKFGDGYRLEKALSAASAYANLDWTSADGKTVLTWAGPAGRSVAATVYLYHEQTSEGVCIVNASEERWYETLPTPTIGQGGIPRYWRLYYLQEFGTTLLLNGKSMSTPCGANELILGAAEFINVTNPGQPNEVRESYLVAAIHFRDSGINWLRIKRAKRSSPSWSTIAEISLTAYGCITPPVNLCAFSASGAKFGMIAHDCDMYTPTQDPSMNIQYPRYFLGNGVIVRGTIASGESGPTASVAVTKQPITEGNVSNILTESWEQYNETTIILRQEIDLVRSEANTAICAIDFIGEEEKHLVSTTSYFNELHQSGTIYATSNTSGKSASISINDSDGMPVFAYANVSDTSTDLTDFPFTRTYRETTTWIGKTPLFYDLRTGEGLYIDHNSALTIYQYDNETTGQTVDAEIAISQKITDMAGAVYHISETVKSKRE